MASPSVGFRFVVSTAADSFRNRSLGTLPWEENLFGFLRKSPEARRHGELSRCFACVCVVPARRFTSNGICTHRWSMNKAGSLVPRRFHVSSARETSLSTDGGKPSRRIFLIIGARIKAAGPDTSILNAISRPPPVSSIV